MPKPIRKKQTTIDRVDPNLAEKDLLTKCLDNYNRWLDSLSGGDLRNFQTLLTFPVEKVIEIAARSPNREYRDMLLFGLACREVVERQKLGE